MQGNGVMILYKSTELSLSLCVSEVCEGWLEKNGGRGRKMREWGGGTRTREVRRDLSFGVCVCDTLCCVVFE